MISSRFPHIVLDCPDPRALGQFYAELTPGKLNVSADWVELVAEQGQALCFQQVADYRAPQWPGQEVPQQFHLDFFVDDLDAAEAAVLRLGATKHQQQPGTSFRVYLDPAGHPVLSMPELTALSGSSSGLLSRPAKILCIIQQGCH